MNMASRFVSIIVVLVVIIISPLGARLAARNKDRPTTGQNETSDPRASQLGGFFSTTGQDFPDERRAVFGTGSQATGCDSGVWLPGRAIMPVYDALYDGGLAHQLCRHEQGAAMAAVGYARASGQVGSASPLPVPALPTW